jgi:uncharacterized protein with NAD-binding domain and iron-sulfur cluster
MDKRIVIVGAGVAGVNAATKLVDNGYPGELIKVIDMGKATGGHYYFIDALDTTQEYLIYEDGVFSKGTIWNQVK